MSEQVERKILDILGNPTESPYGTPIPTLDDAGENLSTVFLAGVTNLVDLVSGSSAPVTADIRRLGEPVQFDPELLGQLRRAGVIPGSTGTFSAAGSYVLAQIDGYDDGLELPNEVANHIFVTTQIVTNL